MKESLGFGQLVRKKKLLEDFGLWEIVTRKSHNFLTYYRLTYQNCLIYFLIRVTHHRTHCHD